MPTRPTALIAGASRGIGSAMVGELLRRGWHVVGTVRDRHPTPLHALRSDFPAQLEIEHLDITVTEQIDALKKRLDNRHFDLLFVNAGIASGRNETVADVSTEEFMQLMVTNALSPMKVVESFTETVRPGGIVGIMSSGQGSVRNNETGQFEVYRASKAALNMLMRSFAARRGAEHALLLLAPGWIKTDIGGSGAKFTVEEVISDIVDTMLAQQGRPGLRFLDRFGKAIDW